MINLKCVRYKRYKLKSTKYNFRLDNQKDAMKEKSNTFRVKFIFYFFLYYIFKIK